MPENAVVKYEPSAISAKTYENLQLNAGVFLEDFDYSSATDKASFKALLEQAITARTGLLGATRGGGTFVATPEIREPEVDGKRYRVKGLTIVDSWDVRLTGTLLEAYPGNFKRTLASADIASTPTSGTATKEVITLRTSIENTDYIDKLAWVTMMGDGSYMVIEL